jgi:hypothetical protein
MQHDVWVESGKVSQQIDRAIKCESSKFDDVTITVIIKSPVVSSFAWSLSAGSRRTKNDWMTPGGCFPADRTLSQQAVSL